MVIGTICGNNLTVETKITSRPKNGGKARTTEITSIGKIHDDLLPLLLGKEGITINLKGGAPGMGGPHRVIPQSPTKIGLEPKKIYEKATVAGLPVVRMKMPK